MMVKESSSTLDLLRTSVRFNVSLAGVLLVGFVLFVRAPVLLLGCVILETAAILWLCPLTLGEQIKLLCELPLGLGSLLAYSLLDPQLQLDHLPAFTLYVNAAVYCNIGMMVLTPTGGTRRGLACRVACVLLTLWIVQLGQRAAWRTVQIERGAFFFTAVSAPWIAAHAAYRFVLLTLPSVSSANRFLEVYSLGLMFLLSLRFPGRPVEQSFGMADTLVTPTLFALACLAPVLPGRILGDRQALAAAKIDAQMDAALAAVVCAVVAIAAWGLVSTAAPAATLESPMAW